MQEKEKSTCSEKASWNGSLLRLMPRGSDKLGLSNMNMGGMGPKMIKQVIKKHNAMTLPQLIEMAQEQED